MPALMTSNITIKQRPSQSLDSTVDDVPDFSTYASISSVSNEILLMIIACIPYTRQEHDRLRLVDSRFKNTVEPSVLRLAVARQQFPEQVALIDCKSIDSKEALDRMAKYETQLAHAVDMCTFDLLSVNETTERLLSCGLRLLDYIHSFKLASDWKQCLFAGPCNSWALPPESMFMLQMTISKMYDYMVDEDLLLNSPAMKLIDIFADCGDMELCCMIEELIEMARRRTFEKMVCSMVPELQLTAFLQEGPEYFEDFMDNLREFSEELTSVFIDATLIADLVPELMPLVEGAVPIECRDWRVLSPIVDIPESQIITDKGREPPIHPILLNELGYLSSSRKIAREAQVNGLMALEALDFDWSTVGSEIRDCVPPSEPPRPTP